MKSTLRNEVIDLLKILADEQYQEKEWTMNIRKTYFVPDEIVSQWFDDYLAGTGGYWERNNIFSQEEVASLDPVSKALDAFYERYKKEADSLDVNLLTYKPWHDVVLAAQVACDALRIS